MNTSRINALAAKARHLKFKEREADWLPQLGKERYYERPNGAGSLRFEHWEPTRNIAQALELLECVAHGRTFTMSVFTDGRVMSAYVSMGNYDASGRTPSLAMTLCALRASPLITDDELNEALED